MSNYLEDLFGAAEFKRQVPQHVEVIEPTGPHKSRWLFDEINEVYLRPTGKHDLYEQPHQELCGIIEEAIGDCTFKYDTPRMVMIGVPRGTWKTSIALENTPPIILTRNPNARILIDTHRHDVSQKRLRAARWHFENNEEFKARFGDDWTPEFRELPWSDNEIVVRRRSMSLIEPSIDTGAIDRSKVGSHYDVIFCDDVVTDKNSVTAEQRQKVYDHILDLLSILEPGGVLILTFTFWNVDDAYMRFIRLDQEREKAGKKPFFQKIIHSAYNPDGSLYFPGRLTHEFLDEQREKLGSRKFAAQYLLQPVSEEDKTFNMDNSRVVHFDFERAQYGGKIIIPRWREKFPVETTMAWDPAGIKGKRKTDFHGLTVVGDDPMSRWWILEAIARKMPPKQLLNEIIKLILFYRPHTFSIEDVGQQTLWLEMLKDEIERRHLGVPMPAWVEQTTANYSKQTRIQMLEPKWERGEIILLPTQTNLLRQFDEFDPMAEMDHEDELDSLVQHLAIARPASVDFLSMSADNPVDPEWEKRRKQRQSSSPSAFDENGSVAGRLGTIWEAGE